MAKDFFWWTRWSPHVGNAITIATGFPVMSAIVGGLWAYLSPSRGLGVALVALATFMMTLWCCIGYLWIKDRKKDAGYSEAMPLWDCAWGLRVDSAVLNRDLGNPDAEWQIRVFIRNAKAIPIKVDILEQKSVIESMLPTTKLELT